jgi:hypothetical protein
MIRAVIMILTFRLLPYSYFRAQKEQSIGHLAWMSLQTCKATSTSYDAVALENLRYWSIRSGSSEAHCGCVVLVLWQTRCDTILRMKFTDKQSKQNFARSRSKCWPSCVLTGQEPVPAWSAQQPVKFKYCTMYLAGFVFASDHPATQPFA